MSGEEETNQNIQIKMETRRHFGGNEGAVTLYIKTISTNTIVNMFPKLYF